MTSTITCKRGDVARLNSDGTDYPLLRYETTVLAVDDPFLRIRMPVNKLPGAGLKQCALEGAVG